MSIALGLIGAGGIAQFHAQIATKVGLKLVAVCDIDEKRAKLLADTYPGAIATNSIDELLANSDVQAVAITTPNATHKPLAIVALKAGKDVLLEKPMAINIAEADELVEAAKNTKQILQVGFVCRYAPASIAAKKYVDSGMLGRIYHVKANLNRRRGIPGLGRWFTTKSQSGGGVLMDLGVHLLDLALHITGHPKPERVCASCTSTFGSPISGYCFNEMWAGPPNSKGVFDVEDAVTALLRFHGGMTLELNTSWAGEIPSGVIKDGLLLLGDKGGCFFDLWANQLTLAHVMEGQLVETKQQFPPEDAWEASWQRQYEVFLDNITKRKAPTASVEDGRAVQLLLDALYKSSEQGCEIAVG